MTFFASDSERLQQQLPFDRHAAVDHLMQADARLAGLIERIGPFDLELHPTHSTFAALARVIVYQQLSGRAASTIFGRVAALFGGEEAMTARVLTSLSDEELRGAGLSRPKLRALRDLGRRVLDGDLPEVEDLRRLDLDVLYERLTTVRGIGPWSVEMIAMFWFGHPDVLPTSDLGIRKGFQLVYELDELPSPPTIEDGAEPWRPFRSVASWYLWRAVDVATP